MATLDQDSVRRVRTALAAAGSPANVIELASSARTAAEAAASLGVALGAIVKSLVFLIDGSPVMALIAGDRLCREEVLPLVLGTAGAVRRADAAAVRRATGFAIGGVAPVGLPAALPCAIDASLGRFASVYAAAGHPHCVFATTMDELQRLTCGVLSDRIGKAPEQP